MTRPELLDLPGEPVGNEEVYAAALRGGDCLVVDLDGDADAMPVDRWFAPADESDHRVLDLCSGSTLDIGCGPGRMTLALAERGRRALGIDKVPEAVRRANARGASAVLADVFGHVPQEGNWDTVLLADGNIGIGGDPETLLRRARRLVHDRGRVVLDLAKPGTGLGVRTLRLRLDELVSDPFPWGVVSAEALTDLARRTGFEVTDVGRHSRRWFAALRVGERTP